jgi:hypothetical protein
MAGVSSKKVLYSLDARQRQAKGSGVECRLVCELPRRLVYSTGELAGEDWRFGTS